MSRCNYTLLLLWLLIIYSSVASAQITLRVVTLPSNTPPDATLYLVGNFNNWQTGDTLYKMQKDEKDVFSFTFAPNQDSLVYKIVRNNSWNTVEGRSNGRARPNRITVNQEKKPLIVDITIASWEDLSGDSLSLYILILLLAAIQGIVLIVAINKLQDNNRKANRILSAILLLVSFALLGRVSVNYRQIFEKIPTIYLLADIVLFTYAPLFYAYLQELLTIQIKAKSKWLHFVPFVLHSCIYVYLIFLPKQTFIDRMVDNDFLWLFATIGFLALCYNIWYWLKSLRVLQIYKENSRQTHSFEQNLTYLNSVFAVQAMCLVAWLFVFLYGLGGVIFNYDYLSISEYSVDAVWIFFSGITYCLGYFAMNQPAIFKVSAVVGQYQTSANPLLLQQYESQETQEITQQETIHTEILPTIVTHISEAIRDIENVQENVMQTVISQDVPQNIPIQTPIAEKQLDITPYKKQLEILMELEKPYLEPQLTLPELATQMQISLHLLSKVINDGYDKNFHDFINSYRIDEFKTLILQPKYRHQTILAVALDAGFNSKTAFNRAFKKLTNSTPREFLKQQSLGEMKDE